MEPFSQLFALGVGLGLEAYGMSKEKSGQSKYNTAQIQEIQAEQAIEEQRRKTMELQAQRATVENLRRGQVANATGLARATAQGAQFGSGAAGGRAQVSSEAAYNATKISQDLQTGRNVFDLNASISQDKIAMANANLETQQGAGWMQLGSSLIGSQQAFGRLFSGFGGGQPGQQQGGGYSTSV